MVVLWLSLCAYALIGRVESFVAPYRTVRIHNHQNADRLGWCVTNCWPPPSFTTKKHYHGQTLGAASRQTADTNNRNTRNKRGVTNGNGSKTTSSTARLNYRLHDNEDLETTIVTMPPDEYVSGYEVAETVAADIGTHTVNFNDPRMIEFVGTNDPAIVGEQANIMTLKEAEAIAGSLYPFAAMMQGSAVYIAGHAGKVAVFHIPGELIEDQEVSDHLLSDMALAWLLGMKIVVVVGSVYGTEDDTCAMPSQDGDVISLQYAHECHNALRVTDAQTIRAIEEEAGFLRTEIERKLNRCLRAHGASSTSSVDEEGNVVGGNFYTAQQFGTVRGEDFQYTGYTSSVSIESIMKVLNNNDVVLLSTVGLSPYGELVNVNGFHLAAFVASQLKASKLIYIANKDSAVLRRKGESTSIQELPLSFSKKIADFHQVKCHKTGFATFEHARQNLAPGAVELLLHLGWSNWALDRGVGRAHIVNPSDGALLEELYTSKNGANTCLYHDDDAIDRQENLVAKEDWDEFFKSAQT